MNRTQRGTYYLAAAAALAAFLVYLPALRNEFVNWDDDIYIYDNLQIRSLDASFFRWAFLGFHVSNWHPLTWVSYAVDYALWGLNPLGYHLTSIIIHAINTALVVLLICKLFEIAKERSAQNAAVPFLSDRAVLIAASVTGLLFGIHPVHVESVAWVSDRKDLLCALFFLLGVLAYVNVVKRTGDSAESRGQGAESKRLTLSALLPALGLFILALMSKPMAVSLPVVLLILDWYPFDRIRSWKTLWSAGAEKLPFLIVGLAASVLTMLAQRAEGAMAAMEVVPLSVRTLVAARALIAYLGKIVLPIDLIPFYPYPQDVSLFSFSYLPATGLMIGITMACAVIAKKQRIGPAVWGYYVATLIPVIGIVQVGGQSMADRYAYLPSIGPFLVMGVMAAAFSEKSRREHQRGFAVFRAAVLLVLVFLSSLTFRQISVWRTSLDLWNDVIKREPVKAPLAYYNRGQVFMNGGRFDRAIEDYSMAITLNPRYLEAFYNRGIAFDKLGRTEQAIADYEKAISLDPTSYQALNNLGILYGRAGSYQKAIASFSKAVDVRPEFPGSYLNRGVTYFLAGRREAALADLNKAIELDPQFAPAYLQRGKLFLSAGSREAANADLRKACELGIQEACSTMP